MKIATYNVNGVNGRLPRLIEWLRKRRKGVHLLVNANAFQRNAGFRMDFLLLSPDLVPRLAAAEVDAEYRGRDKPSDHAPVWIRLG